MTGAENGGGMKTLNHLSKDDGKRVLVGARHYCFVRGVLGREDAFRQALRTLNRLYVELSEESECDTRKPGGRPRKYGTAAERKVANARSKRFPAESKKNHRATCQLWKSKLAQVRIARGNP